MANYYHTQLPDGIRSALLARAEQPEASNEQYAQAVLAVDGMQAPLISPATLASVATPFDDPKSGESLVLLSAGGVQSCLCSRQ